MPGLCGFLCSPTHWNTNQENPHLTDEDTGAEMGDLTCPGSLSQHTVQLRFEPKSVRFVEYPPALETSISHVYSSLGLRGIGIVSGFWNVLLVATGVHLVCLASHNMPLPAFVALRQ